MTSPTSFVARAPVAALIAVTAFALNSCGAQTTSFSVPVEPKLESVSPAFASTEGGETVTLIGDGFESMGPDLRVLFRSYESPSVVLHADSHLTAVVPAGLSAGPADITLMSGATIVNILQHSFTLDGRPQMSVNGISPTGGPVDGGNIVSITGEGFDGTIDVFVGGNTVPSSQVQHINSMLIKVIAPSAASSGHAGVTLSRVEDGQSAAAGFYEYRVSSQYVDSITPSTVGTQGGETILLTGESFTAATTVTVGGKAAAAVEFLSPSQLRVTVPILENGDHAITLNDPQKGTHQALLLLTAYLPKDGQGKAPYVSAAISIDSRNVRFTFSEPMADTIEDVSRYQIFDSNNNTELIITGISRQSDREVLIETLAQSLISYTAVVSGVTDLEGNPPQAAARENQFDRAEFIGRPESASEGITDTDGDGLPDSAEQRGSVITITLLDGSTEKRVVTSDPYVVDTDGDGFTDLDEASIGSDPRSVDTDRDSIDDFTEFNVLFANPASQDSDGDGLNEAGELFYGTSPILADSDGDQLNDYLELFEYNRNPLIADLPAFTHGVSAVNLALDVRYTYEDAQGNTVEDAETIEDSASVETVNYGQASVVTADGYDWFVNGEVSVCGGGGCPSGGEVLANFGGSITASGGYTAFNSTETTANSGTDTTNYSSLNRSLLRLSSVERTSATTREVVGARAAIALNLRLTGATATSLSNLEVSLFQLSPTSDNPGRLLPVAVLTPASGDLVVNLGPLNPTREGIIFASNDIFPSQVERLMKAPNLIVARLTNYVQTDEFGRTFNFTEQDVFNKTAHLIVDYANGSVEQGLIAVAPTFNPSTGLNEGKTVTAALRAFDLIEYYPDKPLADLDLEGADIQGTFGTQDNPSGPGRIVTRVRDKQIDLDNPDRSFWQLITSNATGVGDFDTTAIAARQQYLFVLTRDRDGDGLSEQEEDFLGTSDNSADTDGDGLTDYLEVRGFPKDQSTPKWRVAYYDRPPGSGGLRLDYYDVYSNPLDKDSDEDGLGDQEEYALGDPGTGTWRADPSSIDTDFDGALDQIETNGGGGEFGKITLSYTPAGSVPIATFCAAGFVDNDGGGLASEGDLCYVASTINVQDTDADGLTDGFERLFGVGLNPTVADAIHFQDADKDGLRDSDDEDDTSGDADGDGLPDLLENYLGTGQRNQDSDGDTLADGLEWREDSGFARAFNQADLSAIRSACLNAPACTWPTGEGAIGTNPLLQDTDADGLNDNVELAGWNVRLETYSEGGQTPPYPVTSDPLVADTDGDGLSDETENIEGLDPRRIDTDSDGASDYDELAQGLRNPLKPDIRFIVALRSIRVYKSGEVALNGYVSPGHWSLLSAKLFSPEKGHENLIQCVDGPPSLDEQGWVRHHGLLCGPDDRPYEGYALARAIGDSVRQGVSHPAVPSGKKGMRSGDFPLNSKEGHPPCEVNDGGNHNHPFPTASNFYDGDLYLFDPVGDSALYDANEEPKYEHTRNLKTDPSAMGLAESAYVTLNLREFGERRHATQPYQDNDSSDVDCFDRQPPDQTASWGGINSTEGTFTGEELISNGRVQLVLRTATSGLNDTSTQTPDIEFVFEVTIAD